MNLLMSKKSANEQCVNREETSDPRDEKQNLDLFGDKEDGTFEQSLVCTGPMNYCKVWMWRYKTVMMSFCNV